MIEVLPERPHTPVEEMRGLIRGIHQSGYTDLEAMRRFIVLYEESIPTDGDLDTFYESLDSPDIGLVFGDSVFDDVVDAYTRLGGYQSAVRFPETGRVPSSDWQEELGILEDIFASPTIQHAQSHALYARKHMWDLSNADTDGTRLKALLANPQFLSGLVTVYDFEAENALDGCEPFPDTWPDENDNFLQTVLSAVGYKYANTAQKDWTYKVHGTMREGFASNLKGIANLEAVRPGATKYLSDTYGIRHFSRYPTELLARQFDTAGKVDRPYGIAVSAVSDHNGAFSDYWVPEYSMLSNLYFQTQETHDFLVAEAETAAEFEERLRHFHAVNGEQFKIDFAVIDTHGSPRALSFGTSRALGSLALRSKLNDVCEIFSIGASVAVTGCATGQADGIAQSLSRQFHTIVVAPSETASTERISFIISQGTIRLVPAFGKKSSGLAVMPIIYRYGLPLTLEETAEYLRES